MSHRRKFPLIRAALTASVVATALVTAAWAEPTAQHLGTYVWQHDDPQFGGFSGIEISEDGKRFHALTDRAHLFRGTVLRDERGLITGLEIEDRAHLSDRDGKPLPPGQMADSEGIAIAPDGRIWVSFEGRHRVVGYDDPHGPADPLPRPPILPGMGVNAGFEALALSPEGVLVTLPERSASRTTPFTVLAFEDGAWSEMTRIRRDGRWLPVGADYGPDGRFYLLERDFLGPLGFRSRLRSMVLDADGPKDEHVLVESWPMQFDNLEGISAWGTPEDVRVTLISDDNFLFFQRTEVVEYRIVTSHQHAQGD